MLIYFILFHFIIININIIIIIVFSKKSNIEEIKVVSLNG